MEEKSNEYLKYILIVLIVVGIPLLIVFLTRKDDDSNQIINRVQYELKNYSINEVIPVYITDEELIKKYYSEYISLVINNPEKAFALLDDETLMNKFDNFKSFEKYFNELKKSNDFYIAVVRNYAIERYDGKNYYYVVDSIGNKYTFIESSIMNYQVGIE